MGRLGPADGKSFCARNIEPRMLVRSSCKLIAHF
jgi:hypothetical protein